MGSFLGRAAVTGLDLDGHPCETGQNLTVEETLRAYTRGAAEALGLSGCGALRLGGHADLCILANDPFRHDWAGAPLPEVLATVAGGRVVHGTIATPEARVALTP
jgi:predicted amidohydrolase YtcJ